MAGRWKKSPSSRGSPCHERRCWEISVFSTGALPCWTARWRARRRRWIQFRGQEVFPVLSRDITIVQKYFIINSPFYFRSCYLYFLCWHNNKIFLALSVVYIVSEESKYLFTEYLEYLESGTTLLLYREKYFGFQQIYISRYVYPNLKLRESQITNYYFVTLYCFMSPS